MSTSTFPMARRSTAPAAVALTLLLAGCSSTGPSTSDLISTEPTIDEGDIGEHDEAAGGAMGMCVAEVPDCVDTIVDQGGGDRMMEPDLHQVATLPAGVRAVEMSSDGDAVPFPVFLQEAVVEDDRVTVLFSGSQAPCFWVHHVETEESVDQVVVTVVAAGDPEGSDCTASPVSLQSVTADLEEPLGTRRLLDGSRMG